MTKPPIVFNNMREDFVLQPVAPHGRIGVVALATDATIEQDMRRMLPPKVEMFSNRVRNFNPLTVENLRAMADDITRAAAGILPGLGVDVIVYACTSGAAAIGHNKIQHYLQQAHPHAAVSTPLLATLAALQSLGARKISVLTAYRDDLNAAIAESITAAGFVVININGLGFDDDLEVACLSSADIRRTAIAACADEADALFISCTAFRALEVIADIEREIGRPVVASNQALAWHALRLLGNKTPVHGFGRLLEVNL